MSTTFTWSARLIDAAGAPVAGMALEVQLFDLQANAWTARSSAKTSADGRARGSGTIEDDTLPLAPAFRLVEGATIMSVSPAIARAARSANLTVDFGQVQHLAVAERFTQPRTIATAGLRGEALMVGGVAASETPSTAARDLVERDATIASQTRLLAERDAELTGLREVAAKLEVTTARAQTAEESVQALSTRLAQRDKDLAERDGLLADRARVISDQETAIAGLRATVAEQEKAIAAAVVRPAVGGKTVGMIDLATSMASQLDDAQTTLKPRGFSLGAIQVTAKAVLQDDGGRLELLDKEELKTVPPGSLSDIKLEFIPEKPTPSEDGPRVPDVSQLTESAARRVLASVGLTLDASIGPRALNPAMAPGQAMVQSPVAGAVSAPGAKVLVIFAAAAQQEL